jgi:hypothetical protein
MVGDSRPNGRVIPHTVARGISGDESGGNLTPTEWLAAYQLVGGVMAHQGYDG